MRVSPAVVIALGRAGMVSSRLKRAFRCQAGSAYVYASLVLERRWPEGEAAIATHPGWAYQYAANVVKGRVPELEDAIMRDPKYAVFYAAFVIKGRWPEAEAVIAADPVEWQRYLRLTQGEVCTSSTLAVWGGAVVPPA